MPQIFVDWMDVRINGTDIKPGLKKKLIYEVGTTIIGM